ncbi:MULTISPECIES: ABC transporter permease [unclassified Sedimentibacter]|uniref:ABC transporter permease n=1 Tax=unclassified Sedimentibacter TaxID=2649220 RepID=UPI0027E1977E|nr:ABC transporter permease [Sedimentibacter sp. MB35-C1]WMJ77825.1 ABC transporter permease [Sedimentibacter sp. MB35-C1]
MTRTDNKKIKIGAFLFPLILLALGIGYSFYVVNYPQDKIVSNYVTYSKIFKLLSQHIGLVMASAGAAIVASVPLGIFLTRPKFKRFTNVVVGIVNVGQTVPSLAILALFVSFLGVGFKSGVFALWVYSLLPILNNTLAGILGVDKSILEAAKGMGMTATKILTKIELPIAYPVIMAGIRTAVTINIGTATLAAFIGAGGLGDLIIAGNNINRWQIVILGAVLSALLALLTDYLMSLFEDHLKNI